MPITHLDLAQLLASTDQKSFSARRKLEEVSTTIAKAKKVIVVSGAGISCSSGIPDFRSEDGLYALVKSRYPDAFVTGRDLFSAGLFMNPSTTSIFLTFIAELSLACQKATPTRTHHFIHKLERTGKLLRSYTQNVDGFERRLGMESGGRGKGLHKKNTRNVELHGDLGRVRCTLCWTDYEAKGEWVEMMREGEAPECPTCGERRDARVKRSARATAIGMLRPSIVLYDEPHPLGDDIGELQGYDMSKNPDVLIIMGTSLKVSGLKSLVKEFAKAVHHGGKKPGTVIFVNATKPGKEWEGVIDVHVQGQTDVWVEKVEETWRRVKPGDWEVQTTLDMGIVTGKEHVEGAGPSKSNGASNVDAGIASSFAIGKTMPTPRPTASPSPPPHEDMLAGPSRSAPLSPSKRRNLPTPELTPSPKKSRPGVPTTGLHSTPGKGNLFSAPASPISLCSTEAEQEDSEELNIADKQDDADAGNAIFGPSSPLKTRSARASRASTPTPSDTQSRPLSRSSKSCSTLTSAPLLENGRSLFRPMAGSVVKLGTVTGRGVGKGKGQGKGNANGQNQSQSQISTTGQGRIGKENAPPPSPATAIIPRKAKMPGSPLKTTVIGTRALRARTERIGMLSARRGNREEV